MTDTTEDTKPEGPENLITAAYMRLRGEGLRLARILDDISDQLGLTGVGLPGSEARVHAAIGELQDDADELTITVELLEQACDLLGTEKGDGDALIDALKARLNDVEAGRATWEVLQQVRRNLYTPENYGVIERAQDVMAQKDALSRRLSDLESDYADLQEELDDLNAMQIRTQRELNAQRSIAENNCRVSNQHREILSQLRTILVPNHRDGDMLDLVKVAEQQRKLPTYYRELVEG